MLRAIVGVIVGYIALAIVVFLIFGGAYLALGADGSFKPGNYQPSTAWTAISVVVAVVAALVGGAVCMLISRSRKVVLVLAIIMAVMGCGEGVYYIMNPKPDPGPRTADVALMDAAKLAATPSWHYYLNAAVVLVVLPIGGRLIKPRPAA